MDIMPQQLISGLLFSTQPKIKKLQSDFLRNLLFLFLLLLFYNNINNTQTESYTQLQLYRNVKNGSFLLRKWQLYSEKT